jgi:hypothetical protein
MAKRFGGMVAERNGNAFAHRLYRLAANWLATIYSPAPVTVALLQQPDKFCDQHAFFTLVEGSARYPAESHQQGVG